MKNSRTTKNIYWATTGIIFLFEGVLPALTGHTEFAMQGIRHLGYPDYFASMLVFYKVLGTLAILLPMILPRIKEWAYAGLGLTTISAFISNWAVDGLTPALILPIAFFGIIVASYLTYHQVKEASSKLTHDAVSRNTAMI